MDICRGNGWGFIIRYKSGSIPSIAEEYEKIPEKGEAGHVEFVNEIDYNGKPVNMLKYWEEKEEKRKKIRKEYQFLTDIRLTEKNAEKVVEAGRKTARRTGREISRMRAAIMQKR